MKLPISLVVFTHNSENRLGHIIDKHKDHVSEIIVLDQGSTDKTLEIAKEKADFVIKRRPKGTADPDREYAYAACKEKYILSLDDDEELSDEAIEALPELVRSEVDVIWFVRENLVDGVDIYPILGEDIQCRMWKPGSTRWKDKIHTCCDGAENALVLYSPLKVSHIRTFEGLKKANRARDAIADPQALDMQNKFIAKVEAFLESTPTLVEK